MNTISIALDLKKDASLKEDKGENKFYNMHAAKVSSKEEIVTFFILLVCATLISTCAVVVESNFVSNT